MLLLNNLTTAEKEILAAALNVAGIQIQNGNSLSFLRAKRNDLDNLIVFYQNKNLHRRKIKFLQKIIDKIPNPDNMVELEEIK